MVAIIDYAAGNLTSVKNALGAIGAEVCVAHDVATLEKADRILFPGVGAAKSAMANLKARGLDDAIRHIIATGKPFLGICLGMQILFEHTEEDGGVDLLGILPGQVKRFPSIPGCKVPEIGWNRVEGKGFQAEYYFVHSYYAQLGRYTIGETEYANVRFTAAVQKGNVTAYQFHPEKSGAIGLNLLKEWLSC